MSCCWRCVIAVSNELSALRLKKLKSQILELTADEVKTIVGVSFDDPDDGFLPRQRFCDIIFKIQKRILYGDLERYWHGKTHCSKLTSQSHSFKK